MNGSITVQKATYAFVRFLLMDLTDGLLMDLLMDC